MIVRQYISVQGFETGIDKETANGFILHSWKMVYSDRYKIVIIAVFRGRHA